MATSVTRRHCEIRRVEPNGNEEILFPRTTVKNVFLGLSSDIPISNKIVFMGICNDEAYITNKAVTINGFELYKGIHATIVFTRGNSIAGAKININGTGLYPIYYEGNPVGANSIRVGARVLLTFNGTQYDVVAGAGGYAEASIANNTKFYFSGVKSTGSIGIEYYDENIYTDANTGRLYASEFSGDGSRLTNLDASKLASGTIPYNRLPTSDVTPGSYGPNNNSTATYEGTISIPEITVDSAGRITSATTRTITMPGGNFLPITGGVITKNAGRSIEIQTQYIRGDGQSTLDNFNQLSTNNLTATGTGSIENINTSLIKFGSASKYIDANNYSGTAYQVENLLSRLVDSTDSARASGVVNKALTANQGFLLQAQIDDIVNGLQGFRDPLFGVNTDYNVANTNSGSVTTSIISCNTIGFIKLDINVNVNASVQFINADITPGMMDMIPEASVSDYIVVSAMTNDGRNITVTKGSNNNILIYVPTKAAPYNLNDMVLVIFRKRT